MSAPSVAPVRRVIFDASSLGNLAASEQARREFPGALDARNLRIVNGVGVMQGLRARHPEAVREQLVRLAALGFDKAEAVIPHDRVRAAEVRGESFSGPPVYSGTMMPLFADARNPGSFRRRLIVQQPKILLRMAPKRRSTREQLAFWYDLPESERKRLKQSAGASDIGRDVIDGALGLPRRVLTIGESESFADRVRDAPRLHRASLVFAAMLALAMLTDIMSDEWTPRFPWLKHDPDDGNDLHIAVDAAYCDMLVTDDRGLLGRTRFLRERGCVFYESVTLSEFLAPTW